MQVTSHMLRCAAAQAERHAAVVAVGFCSRGPSAGTVHFALHDIPRNHCHNVIPWQQGCCLAYAGAGGLLLQQQQRLCGIVQEPWT